MKEKHYRIIEQMLNNFKNKKLSYSEFIDKIFELEDEYADWKIKECIETNKIEIDKEIIKLFNKDKKNEE